MIRPQLIARIVHINWVLISHGLDSLLLDAMPLRSMRVLRVFTPYHWRPDQSVPRGVRLRRALEELGPIFVKFGQTLSTRRDLLPEDIADQLVLLQDQVPPFPGAQARAIVEKDLGAPVTQLFRSFDERALASASIAQVHAAVLRTGEEVVVKVLRPGVSRRIRADLDLLHELAKVAQMVWSDAKRLHPVEVVQEFDKTLQGELDLLREAANASTLRRNFQDSQMLYVPAIHWDFTRERVMTMERIYGIPVNDVERIKAAGVDLQLLAERGVEIFFTQVFRDNFFHADMHPGNIFVGANGSFIAVDFGIVGSLTRADQLYLAENFRAFFNRDYRRVAEMHVESGWVPRSTRVEELEAGIRSVCEPIFQKPLKEISYGHLLLRLFQIARRFDMEVQPQLVLLQKTLLHIEGLGRQLYPDLDLWKTAKPFLENWFKQRVSIGTTLHKIGAELPDWIEQMPEFPGLVHRLVRDGAHGHLEVRWRSEDLAGLRSDLAKYQRRLRMTILGCAFVISAALLANLTGGAPEFLAATPWVTAAMGLLGIVLLVAGWLF